MVKIFADCRQRNAPTEGDNTDLVKALLEDGKLKLSCLNWSAVLFRRVAENIYKIQIQIGLETKLGPWGGSKGGGNREQGMGWKLDE